MYGSNWSRHVAALSSATIALALLVGILLFTYHAGQSSGRRDAETEGYAAQYPTDTSNRIKACFSESPPGERQQCVEEAITSSHESLRSEADLNAQRQMAQWAWWLLIVTLAQVPIGIAGLIALLITIEQGRSALAHAKETTSLQLRPYVVLGRMTIKESPRGGWLIKSKIVNSGVIPAKEVESRSGAKYYPFPLSENVDPIYGETTIYPYITNQRQATSFDPITMSDQDLPDLQAIRGAVVCRVWIRYKPTESGEWEVVDQIRMFTGDDLQRGDSRLIPNWAYTIPRADQNGQEQLALTPAPENG